MTGHKTRRSTGASGGSGVDRPDRLARHENTRSGGSSGPAQSDGNGPCRERAYEFATKTPPATRAGDRDGAVEPLSG